MKKRRPSFTNCSIFLGLSEEVSDITETTLQADGSPDFTTISRRGERSKQKE